MEAVTRHPFDEWVTDGLGESTVRTFAEDVPLQADTVAPGPSRELVSGTDAAVVSDFALYFDDRSIPTSEHDDWTVRGIRCQQVGAGEVWDDDGFTATVVRLNRRTG